MYSSRSLAAALIARYFIFHISYFRYLSASISHAERRANVPKIYKLRNNLRQIQYSPYCITRYLLNTDEFSHFDSRNLLLVTVTHMKRSHLNFKRQNRLVAKEACLHGVRQSAHIINCYWEKQKVLKIRGTFISTALQKA